MVNGPAGGAWRFVLGRYLAVGSKVAEARFW